MSNRQIEYTKAKESLNKTIRQRHERRERRRKKSEVQICLIYYLRQFLKTIACQCWCT